MENNTKSFAQESDTFVIDLQRVFRAVLNNIWKIMIATLLCGSLFLVISLQFMTPMYRTSTSFYVNNKIFLNGGSTNITPNDHAASISLVNSYIAILKQHDTLMRVIEHSDLNLSYGEIAGMISATAVEDTEVFSVTVTSDNPNKAATVANSVAHVVTTQIRDIIEGSSVKVVNYPTVPSSPYSPNYFKNTVIGLFIGLIISAGTVILIEIFDTKIKCENDVKKYCNYPILAIIPDMNRTGKHGYYSKHYSNHYGQYAVAKSKDDSEKSPCLIGKDIDFATTEAYKLLRTKLQYSLADDQPCRVYVVSSALTGEGKSITSINLAYSLSRLNKRVLLIDGDMRRPTLAKKMSLSNYPGLSEYLTGFMGMEELLQEFADDSDQTPVSVLTAGNTPPNPVELINSAKMSRAIETLRKQYDSIIIDMPPICDVSDALVAAKIADGVLMVVRNNYCSSTAVLDAVAQFEFVNAKILGVVFNCFSEKNSKYCVQYHNNQYGDNYTHNYISASVDHTIGSNSAGKDK